MLGKQSIAISGMPVGDNQIQPQTVNNAEFDSGVFPGGPDVSGDMRSIMAKFGRSAAEPINDERCHRVIGAVVSKNNGGKFDNLALKGPNFDNFL